MLAWIAAYKRREEIFRGHVAMIEEKRAAAAAAAGERRAAKVAEAERRLSKVDVLVYGLTGERLVTNFQRALRQERIDEAEKELTAIDRLVLGMTGEDLLRNRARARRQITDGLRQEWFDDHEDELRDSYDEIVPWWRDQPGQFARFARRAYSDRHNNGEGD